MKKNNFLITGATGFVGSNLARELVKKRERVSVLVRNKARQSWRLKDIESQLDIYECNLLSTSLKSIVEKIKPDFIFNLAAYGISPHENDIKKMIDINLKGTINLIEAAKNIPIKLFINTGTCVEYGVKDSPMKEEDTLAPVNDYGVTKAAVTLYCQKEAIRKNVPLITLRLFSVYGYYDEKDRFIPSVVRSAISNEPIKVSSSKSVRDFVFIEDVVNAYLKAIEKPLPKGEIFNIGSGKQYSLGEIVKLCLGLSGSRSEVVWGSVPAQTRFIEPLRWEADFKKARRILKWEPKNTMELGLRKTIQWFKENRSLYGVSL